jgi:hypothetical protein
MRRITFSIVLAAVTLFAFGSLAPSLPAAHAQAAAPTISVTPNPVTVGSSASVNGHNFTPNNWAYLYFQRPDGTTGSVAVATGATGAFASALGFSAAHGVGREYVAAYDFGTRQWTSFAIVSVVSVVPAQSRSISVSASSASPGQTITVNGSGFTPGNWVYVTFQRPDRTVGAVWAQTGSTGAFAVQLGFDPRHGCGVETAWAYDYAAGVWSAPVTVTVAGCGAQAAPGNLRILSVVKTQTAPEQTTVTLQWQDTSAGESGFRIHTTLTRLYGGTDTQVNDVAANVTTAQVSFVSGGINPVKTACFTVTALAASGESAPSNQVCRQL